MTPRAVYLRVIKTQAHTDSKNTTDAVTMIERFLRWKILRRSRNVGSLSGKVFNWSPLPSLKCVLSGSELKLLLILVSDRPEVGFGSRKRKLPIGSFSDRFEQRTAASVCAYTGRHDKLRLLQQHGKAPRAGERAQNPLPMILANGDHSVRLHCAETHHRSCRIQPGIVDRKDRLEIDVGTTFTHRQRADNVAHISVIHAREWNAGSALRIVEAHANRIGSVRDRRGN